MQVLGVRGLSVHRVHRDEGIGDVGDLVENLGEQGDFVRLLVDVDLGQDDTVGVIEDTQQVDWVLPVAGRAHRFTVHCQRPAHPSSASGPVADCSFDGIEAAPDPGRDRRFQGRGVNADEDPPDPYRAGDPRAQPQTRAGLGGQIGGPLPDRRERAGAGQHRAHHHRQDHGERVTHPPAGPRIRDLSEGLEQSVSITICERVFPVNQVRDLSGDLVKHGSDGRR